VAAWLPETLASVFASTTRPDQVVVIDDGSTDDVAGSVAPWADRTTLVRRPQGGEGAAKNTGLSVATGDVIVNLDGDDTMHPDRLTAVREVLTERPDLDILTSEFDQFGPGARESWRLAPRFPVDDQRAAVLRWNFLPAPALRRLPLIAAGGYVEHLRYGPDWECYARMIVRGSRAGLLLDPLYQYRRWSGQQTADQQRVLDGRLAVLHQLTGLPALTDDDRRTLAETAARARMDALRWALRSGTVRRRQAWEIARTRCLPLRARALGASAAVAPVVTSRLDRRRRPA
jgi:hypothetical protein